MQPVQAECSDGIKGCPICLRRHGDRESRYDYLYPPDEQAELLADVTDVSEKAALTFVVYNNHFGGKSLVNALEMKPALGGEITNICLTPCWSCDLIWRSSRRRDRPSGSGIGPMGRMGRMGRSASVSRVP